MALALVFLFSFAIFAAVMLVTTHYMVGIFAATIPMEVNLGFVTLPAIDVINFSTCVLIAFEGLLFILLYFYIDRLVVYPVRMISKALNTFEKTGNQIQMPTLRSSKEVNALTKGFADFIESVDEVHKRDMEVSRVKSDFISTAAHQIRTPLTGIRWALEALEKEHLTELQEALVKNAVDKSRDLVAIVGTLLDISSIESGKYKYNFEITSISPIIAEVCADFAQMAATNSVHLTCDSGENIPPVRIDANRIKWVLNNLVENAVRYTPAGGSVQVFVDANAKEVVIHVKDTGIGIPSQDRANIFERFYRAGNAVAKETQGNGLGLYIARTIVNDHGGDLDFEPNAEGPGTIFTLSLPATVAALGS